MSNSRLIAQRLRILAATIDRAITFDRPRDGMGQFAPDDDSAGPDEMTAAYGEPQEQANPVTTVSPPAANPRFTAAQRLASLRKPT